jgi:hypothetical protein
MEHTMAPRVLQVLPAQDYTVYAYFNDGTVHLYNARPLIERGGVFSVLCDEDLFKNTATVLNHPVAWDISGNRDGYDCLDVDPLTVSCSPEVGDPLAC